jgi:hypothetical protein
MKAIAFGIPATVTLPRLKLVLPVSLLSVIVAAANGQTNSCNATADDLLTACRRAAQSNYDVALANCDNVPNAAAQQRCRDRVAADLKDAQETCTAEYNVRVGACQRFGPAPYHPRIDPSNFVSAVTNPYFPLPPGTTFVYEGQTADGFEHDEFAVTHRTRTILGVTCVEVHDTVRTDGKLTEDTLDWFAQDKDGNIWYFGENTHELENGLITTIEGSFVSGVDRAKPGIVMKAHPMVGDFYRQEFALANAEDYAETVSLGATVRLANGHTYNNCLKSKETTPLEPHLLEFKFYAPGVGNVLEVDAVTGDRLELVQIKTNSE